MPTNPLGPTGLLAQSLTLPAGSQSMAMGGMGLRAQGMDGRKKGVIGNWLGLSGNAAGAFASDGAADAQGNIVLSGRANSANNRLLVGRYAPDGQRLWSNEVVGLTTLGTLNRGDLGSAAIALDAGGNVYAVGSDNSLGVCQTRKYSPSGQLLWQRSYGAGAGVQGRAVAVGGGGGVYVLMRVTDSGFSGNTTLLVKYNASGTFQWSRNVEVTDGFGIGIDAQEGVYIEANGQDLLKINSAGALQWAVQKTSGGAVLMYRLAVSPDGKVYAAGNSGFTEGPLLLSFDPSGSAVWARQLGSGGAGWWNDVILSGQSLYCIGVGGPSNSDILMAEYDISGTLKWQRTISGAGTNQGFSVAEIDANNLAIFGATGVGGASGNVFIGRIPKSGPPIGTIGPFTVSASNRTPSSPTATFATFSPADQTVGAATADTYSDSAVLMPTNTYPF